MPSNSSPPSEANGSAPAAALAAVPVAPMEPKPAAPVSMQDVSVSPLKVALEFAENKLNESTRIKEALEAEAQHVAELAVEAVQSANTSRDMVARMEAQVAGAINPQAAQELEVGEEGQACTCMRPMYHTLGACMHGTHACMQCGHAKP